MTTTAAVLDDIDATLAVVPDLTPEAVAQRETRTYEPIAVPSTANRRMPWSGLVTGSADADETLTSSELLVKAGLNWTVGIRPLYRKMNNGEFQQHPRARETFRSDNEFSLGEVKSHYEPFSNEDVFAFGDYIAEQGFGRWLDAGEQSKGRRVFMTMLLNEFDVLDGDPYKLYLFFRASHDGSTGLNGWILPFRVWCTNQQQLINAQHQGHVRILHTKNIGERVAEAQHSLAEAASYSAVFKQLAEKIAAVTVSDRRAKDIISRLVPEGRNRRDVMIADMLHVYKTSSTVEPYRGNGYGLLNAVTEYYGHVKDSRSDNARFESVMRGEGAKARAKVLKDLAGLN